MLSLSSARLSGARYAVTQRIRTYLMEKDAKEALQVTKEIVVKFIETGRVSPTNFSEIFPSVYQVVLTTITRPGLSSTTTQNRAPAAEPDDAPREKAP